MKIILTGGGTAGHVMPNIALLPKLRGAFTEIHYIGSNGIEKEIIKKFSDIRFHEIHSVKFVRKFTLKNLAIPFKLCKEIREAKKILKDVKPDVIFSKGGYVALPVVFAAGKTPVLTHESDLSLGLANKLMASRCMKVLTSFPITAEHVKRGIYTGSPIRAELFCGKREKGLGALGFSGNSPVLLVMGGSLGATAINSALRGSLAELTKKYDIVHLTGKGNSLPSLNSSHYKQIEFTPDIADIFAASDLVVSRAGSNAVAELLSLKKPTLLIPLPKDSSRGDQIDNANYLKSLGLCNILYQETLTPATIVTEIVKLHETSGQIKERLAPVNFVGTEAIFQEILSACNRK